MENFINYLPHPFVILDEKGKIVTPLTEYTKSFFKNEISEGQTFFEILTDPDYKKSESYSLHQSNWLAIMGEDELQFDLSVDGLIHSLTWKEVKKLKFKYTPLWENDVCNNVLISIEDETEVLGLKKEFEVIKNLEHEANLIIKEITSIEKESLETFLEENLNILKEIKANTLKMKTSPELFEDILREIHTLKGNSRMLKLNILSQKIHEAETNILKIGKETIDDKELFLLLNEINSILQLASKYSHQANKIFRIKDKHFHTNVGDFHRLTCKVDLNFKILIKSFKKNDQGAIKKNIEGIESLFKESKEVSQFTDARRLSQKLDFILTLFDNEKKYDQQFFNDHLFKEIIDYLNGYWTYFKESPCADSLDLRTETWVQFTIETLKLSLPESYFKGIDNFGKMKLKTRKEISYELKVFARENNFFYLERLCTQIFNKIKDTEKSFSLEIIHNELRRLWDFIFLVIYKDTSFQYPPKVRGLISNSLINKDIFPKDLDHSGILYGLFNELHKNEIVFKLFLNTYKIFTREKSEQNLLEDILGVGSDHELDNFENFKEIVQTHNSMSSLIKILDELRGSNFLAKKIFPVLFLKPLDQNLGYLYLSSAIYRFFMSPIEENDHDSEFDPHKLTSVYNQNILFLKEVFDEQKSIGFKQVKQLEYAIENLCQYPLQYYLNPLREMTKDIARFLEKKVNLDIEGEMTYIPRNITYALKDCLIHLIRNSIDHGIEDYEKRTNMGKPSTGKILVKIEHKEDHILIRYEDDGAGLDKEKILKKHNVSKDMSDEEIFALIFTSSFTTKDKATVISGRGIGMDVVLKTIEDLGGNLKLDQDQSKGFRLSMILPVGKS